MSNSFSPSGPAQPPDGIPRERHNVAPKAYLLTSHTGLDAANVSVFGGGGLLQTQGSSGLTRVTDCSIDDYCQWYGIYCGALASRRDDEKRLVNPLGQPDPNGKPASLFYDERFTESIEILGVDMPNGSGDAAMARFVAFRNLLIDGAKPGGARCLWSDTDAQSAVHNGKRAVKNSVLRIHHGDNATVRNTSFRGDIYFGPMAEGDGGINCNGAERKFRDAARLRNLVIEDCDFSDCNVFKITPGAVVTFRRCDIEANGTVIIDSPFPYMNRPLSIVRFEDCDLRSTTTKKPKAYDGKGAKFFSMDGNTRVGGT